MIEIITIANQLNSIFVVQIIVKWWGGGGYKRVKRGLIKHIYNEGLLN